MPAPAAAGTINNFGTFNINTTAGNNTYNNFPPNGLLRFRLSATGGPAIINNSSRVEFHDTSTGGNAIIANNNSLGGTTFSTSFQDNSTAGNATIITSAGGTTAFLHNATAGNAQLTANVGGIVDFSGTSGPSGNNQIMAGSIAGAGTFFLGANQLTVGGNNLSTTVSGTIQDGGAFGGTGGSLVKVGTGTLTLAGANSYTGGTLLAAGTLRLENNLALGTGALTTTGSVIDYAAGVTIANPIVVSSSTTQLQVMTNTATQAGTISELNGPRPIEKIGAGTLVLNAANTYTGVTTISSGTLQLGSGGASGSLAGDVVNNSTFAINRSDTFTFGNVISGAGEFQQNGSGTTILTATNTYTGATTVNAGALVVDGSIANSAAAVNSGALLAGSGRVGAITVNSGGTLAPGPIAMPGTMTVAGNVAFQSGAVYLVQVNAANGAASSVAAGGSAALAGTVNAAFASGSYGTRTFTILSAAGGLGGTTFGSLTTSNLPAGFTANLSFTDTDAILNLTATLGALAGPLSANQANVANALNNFFNNGGTLPPAFVTIFGLTGSNLGNALSQLSGEAATGAQQAGFQIESQFLGLMLDPFVYGRSGVAGASGPALGYAPEREALPDDTALAYSSMLKAPTRTSPVYEPRWTAWGGAYGGGNRTSGDPAVLGSHDLSASTAGFAGGLDYQLTRDNVVGFALAGGGTNWSLAQGLGGGKSDAFQAGVYGAIRSGPTYLAAAFAYANHWMSTDRFAFAGDHLTANFNAQSLGARVESGYRFATFYGGLTPYAAIQPQSFRTPSYSETDTNSGGLALAYAARTATDTRSELGARFDRLVAFSPSTVLALRARLAWAHDWVSDPTLAAVFQMLPGASFVVNGARPAKDSALASAGSELRLANGVTLLAKFDGEFAAHSSTYAGTGTIRYAW